MGAMTSEPVSDPAACPECGSPDVSDALNAKTDETVVTQGTALAPHPVHVVRLKCKHGHVWSRAKPHDSRSDWEKASLL